MGVMLGYLAEQSRLLRTEAATIAKLLANVRVDAGIARALTAIAKDVLVQFNASRLMLVVEELGTGRVYRWDTEGGWGVSQTGLPISPYSVDRLTYLFAPPYTTLAAVRRRWPWSLRGFHRIVTLDSVGRVAVPKAILEGLPRAFVTAHPFKRLISVPVAFGGEWAGRIFLFDPRVDVRLITLTQFLQGIVLQVSPAVFSVELMSRLHARAGALERARVARELHDGVIQSMIGVEMQLQVLRGRDGVSAAGISDDLMRLQNVVRSEVLSLRELMQQMRPVEFEPDELLEYLADMVQRFGRETGISAQFLTDLKDVELAWRVCFELVRIVQEGLVNVRKHSGAQHVIVRFSRQDDQWALEIKDDGCGFPFEGRLLNDDLHASHRGPTIIKERVKAVGGQLTIESTPGRGSRLEILVPQETHG
jgi:signal transduction histidine kinase